MLRLLLMSNYINLFGFALFSPFYALFTLKVGANAFQTGAGWALYTAIEGILIITFGKIEDHIVRKERMVALGYFWLAFAALAYLLVHNTTSLFIVLAVNAIGNGILMPAWKSRAIRSLSKKEKKPVSGHSLMVGIC